MQTRWTPSKPIRQIDVRTFDHDVQVMKSRLLLEDFENVQDWESDRQLKCQYPEYFQYQGSRDSAPDGVYKSVSGKVIAFEYEIAQKSKKRYQDKVRKHVECIRSENTFDRPKYDLVRIVCEKECVFKALKSATAIFNGYFVIEMASDFFGRYQQNKVVSYSQQISEIALQVQ